MKPDNWNRFAAGLLAILLCLCSFSMPVFASGSDPAPEPLPEISDEEPTRAPGAGGGAHHAQRKRNRGGVFWGQTAYHRDHQSRELFLHPH